MKPKPARFYFSFRSPYSWVAAHLLCSKYRLDNEVEWVPFFEPDERSRAELRELGREFPYVPMSRAKHLYILQDIKRLTTGLGLSVRWPVDVAPWWEPAHLGYVAADKLGCAREYFWAVSRARWERGEDISQLETLARIEDELGVPDGAFTQAHEDEDCRMEGLKALVEVADNGVFGVPLFTLGYSKFWGVDRLPDFARLMLEQSNVRHAEAAENNRIQVPSDGSAHFDHAGGCG